MKINNIIKKQKNLKITLHLSMILKMQIKQLKTLILDLTLIK